jgi:hypothetical protein
MPQHRLSFAKWFCSNLAQFCLLLILQHLILSIN